MGFVGTRRLIAAGVGCALAATPLMGQTAAPAAPQVQVPAAAPAPTVVTPPASVAKGKPASNYVKCDGSPNNMSGGETAARLIALSLVVGLLAPPPEEADVSKRLSGLEGVEACTAALAAESNEVRGAQLRLARAIHYIEAKDYDAAIAAAREVKTASGLISSTLGFKQSIGLSATEIEIAALLRAGKPGEAEALAVTMAMESPWDVDNLQHAARYVGLTGEMTPAKRDFWAHYVRVRPDALGGRSLAREWIGDYAGSAADVDLGATAYQAFRKIGEKDDVRTFPSILARRSVDLGLAGDMARSEALAAEARAAIDAKIGAEAVEQKDSITQSEELLDFQRIIGLLAAGKATEARATFGARSRWTVPTSPAVATLSERLRAGSKPAELTGALAKEPAAIRAEALTQRAVVLTDGTLAPRLLWSSIRAYVGPGSYAAHSKNAWRTDKSKYLVKSKAAEPTPGEFIYVNTGAGMTTGKAFLLHAALLAKSRGKTGFLISPTRNTMQYGLVRFGNPGDDLMPAELVLDADTVIAAISPEIPRPLAK